MKKNIEFIDIAKGLGIILVVCSHASYPLMSWASLFYIPVFFVISGYCTNRPIRIMEKLWKLIIPYILFTTIAFIVSQSFSICDILGALYARWSLFPYNNENNILFLQSGNCPLWFLPSMFTSFCVFKIIQESKFQYKTTVFFSLYLIISYALSFLPILLPWSWDTAFLFALFLFEGFLIRKYNILEKITTNHIILLIIIYAIFRYYTWSVNLSIRYYGRSLFLLFPGASVGSVILIILAKKIEGKNISHIFSKIGRNSLSIFCIHWPFITISERLLYYINLPKDTIIYDVIHLTTILLITYPIALIIERFLIKPIYRINPFKSS